MVTSDKLKKSHQKSEKHLFSNIFCIFSQIFYITGTVTRFIESIPEMKHLIWLFIFYSSTSLSGISQHMVHQPEQKYGYLYLFIPQHVEFTIEIITPSHLGQDDIEVDYFLSKNQQLWVNDVFDERGYVVPVGEYSKIIITYADRTESFTANLEPALNEYNHYYFY